MSVEKVLASHGWLALSDLELIYGASGAKVGQQQPQHQQKRQQRREREREAEAWEGRLWGLWRELTAMEGLLLSLSEPTGPARPGTLPPAAVGTLQTLNHSLPQRTRRVLVVRKHTHTHIHTHPPPLSFCVCPVVKSCWSSKEVLSTPVLPYDCVGCTVLYCDPSVDCLLSKLNI